MSSWWLGVPYRAICDFTVEGFKKVKKEILEREETDQSFIHSGHVSIHAYSISSSVIIMMSMSTN